MKLIAADYIIGIAVLLMMLTHGATQFIAVKYSTYEKDNEKATAIMNQIEVNPIAKYILTLNKFKFLWSFFLVPSLIISYYYYQRHKWLNRNVYMLNSISVFFLAFASLNFLNDLSYLLGLLAR